MKSRSTNSSFAIEIKELHRSFDQKHVLKGITISLKKNEITLLKGNNGSGKTTLLRILATLLKPTSGDALLNGYSVVKDPEKAKYQMGWIPSTQNGFLPRLNGLDNLYLFGSLFKLGKREVGQKIDQWQSVDPFKNALDTPYYLCSAGMKQALGLFRGALHDPPILLLDEPGLHLDSESTQVIRDIFINQFQDKTILFSAHEHNFLSELATQKIELNKDGRLFEIN